MMQLIAAVIATVAIVVFAMSNTHHVQLSLAFGAPLEIRLITLVGAAYLAGMVTSWIGNLARRATRQSHQKRVKAIVKRSPRDEGVEV